MNDKWIYKLKKNFEKKIQRYKTRWIIRDFEQRYEIDFNEIFVVVIKLIIYKILFVIIVFNDWNIEQINVKTIFLYENLNEFIYIEIFINFAKFDIICKLNKIFYNLKQISKIWFKTLINFFIFLNYRVISKNSNVYRYDSNVYVIIYVDDLFIFEFNRSKITILKQKLSKRFHMSNLKSIVYYLNLKMTRNRQRKIIRINQKIYFRKIMTNLNMSSLKKIENFMNSNLILETISKNFQIIDQHKIRYQSIVDFLIYLMFETRSNIVFAIFQISRFVFNSIEKHWIVVQKIFRYLKKYSNLKFIYDNEKFLIYTNANWTRDNDKKSIENYLYKLEKTTINWNNKRQIIIVFFNCETKYITTFETIKKILWMRRLFTKFDYINFKTMIFQIDNQNVIALIENSIYYDKIKHIEFRYHFIREKIIENLIKFVFVSTKQQIVDKLTKSLVDETFIKFIKKLFWDCLNNANCKSKTKFQNKVSKKYYAY